MTDPNALHDIGYLKGQVDALVKQVAELNRHVAAMEATMNKARGGWMMLVAVGGIAGTVGAFVGKFLPFLVVR